MSKKEGRIHQFDFIRVVSLIGILLCHSLFESADFGWLGRYFALMFNFLFLILSAFLFGLAWEKNGRPSYNKDFLSKRISRLSKTYYPYLVVLFLFLYLSQDYFSVRNIVSHVIYLPWFDKIDGYGHLWFMTMIVLCYVGCYVATKVNRMVLGRKLLIVNVLVGGGIVADYIIDSLGLPGYMVPYIIGYIIIFSNSTWILERVSRIKLSYNIAQFLIINAIGVLMFANDIFSTNSFIAYLVGIICAGSTFCLMYNVLKAINSFKFITWLSGISFEIYLVHEFFLGRYSVYNLIDNPLLGFLCLISCSVISAICLRFLSQKMESLKVIIQ